MAFPVPRQTDYRGDNGFGPADNGLKLTENGFGPGKNGAKSPEHEPAANGHKPGHNEIQNSEIHSIDVPQFPRLSKQQPTVSVIIPALNEAENLPHVLPYLPAWVDEVLLVDGDSTDGTPEVARRLWPDVRIIRQMRPGKGAALRTGFAAATGDIIIMMDADCSTDPGEIPLFCAALLSGADFVKGSRFLQGAGTADMEYHRMLGNWAFILFARLLFGGHFSDLCYGYIAFWRRILPQLELDGDGFEIETMMNLRALRAGLKVAEVPSFEKARKHGSSRLRAIPDGLRVLKTILRECCTPAPGRRDELKPTLAHNENRINGHRLNGNGIDGTAHAISDMATADIATDTAITSSRCSVVICAYTEKRWRELVTAIESLRHQTLLPHEIIVVIDHNPALLERARSELVGVVVVENQESHGLSGARNSGLAVAQGEVIAFLDDDAVAAPNWLEELAREYADPQVIGVGGASLPIWMHKNPSWFPDEFHWVIGCSYRGMPHATASVRNLIGCNMSFRREVFEAVGGFRNGIGRIDTQPLGCEETELCIRTNQLWPERVLVYKPEARVFHHVPPNRACWHYFFARCYSEGMAKASVSRTIGTRDGLVAELSYSLQTLPAGIARGFVDAAIGQDPAGLARASAIVVGLAVTLSGYLVGRVSRGK